MTMNQSTRVSAHPRTDRALGLALASILAVVILAGFGSLAVNASSPAKFDNVQVFIQTSQDLPFTYTLTAYNTSGYQVAYYQSGFAEAAFELPGGTYLFTVQASYYPPNPPCTACVVPENAAAANSTGGTVVPIFRLASSNEYGYSIDEITGPSNIYIDTMNSTTLPTAQVNVHVAYANGTAAQGAWVYGYAVDDNYYAPNINSSAQTGADGTAVLTMPQAPLLVTADLSVPITLPQHQSNVTVTVGGQKVNVTLYWQPSSINLEGQILILPPQTSGNITLLYQPQQYYYPIPLVSSATGVPGTTTTQTETATTQSASQNRIPPFSPSSGQVAAVVGTNVFLGGNPLLLGGVAAVVTLGVLTLVLMTVRGKRKQKIVSA